MFSSGIVLTLQFLDFEFVWSNILFNSWQLRSITNVKEIAWIHESILVALIERFIEEWGKRSFYFWQKKKEKKLSRGLMTFSLSTVMWNNNFCCILNCLWEIWDKCLFKLVFVVHINMTYSWFWIIWGLNNFG